MDIKDTLTLIGIILVLTIGLINIAITVKNRRNAIREHIFKEQISVHYKLLSLISQLNNEADNLLNSESKRHENDFELIREKIQDVFYENEFILENETISLIQKLLKQSIHSYIALISLDKEKAEKAYHLYYESYFDLLKFTRNTFGIDTLSKENKNLHHRNEINNSKAKKILIETLESTAKNMLNI
jgi:hypothetical protein